MSPLATKRRRERVPAGRRRPAHGNAPSPTDPHDEPNDGPPEPVRTNAWTGGTALTAKAATVGLWCLVAMGPVGLGISLAGSSSSAPAPLQASAADVAWSEASVAGERARVLVETWLTASREHSDRLEELYAGDTGRLPEVGETVRDVAVASVTEGERGVWSITVGVDVQVPAAEGTEDEPTWSRRYFAVPIQVAVTESGAAAQALTLPAPVSGPAVGQGTALEYPVSVPTTGALSEAVTQFLAAMLAGEGDISRFTSPGVVVPAVVPAPYTAVDLRRLDATTAVEDEATPAEGQVVHVHARVELARVDGQASTAEYGVELTARAGRWEVSDLTPFPNIRLADGETVTPAAEAADEGEING